MRTIETLAAELRARREERAGIVALDVARTKRTRQST
jgi:hypothetical protein